MSRRYRNPKRVWSSDPDMHGSAKWADAAHLLERGYGPNGRHTLGYLPPDNKSAGAVPLTYAGDRHQMIVAPTRGGKGVSGAIPRLLEHPGSAIVLDIKDAELSRITANYRRHVFGQNLVVIDPDDIVASSLGLAVGGINPMHRVDLDTDDAFDEAMTIANACVVPDSHGESHWSAEAAALIAGLILRQAEFGGDLTDVRADLNRNIEDFQQMLADMQASPYPLVKAAGSRLAGKADRELSGVLSTAQQNTHFLESTRLAGCLSRSSVDLSRIGENTTIYIALPARRIQTSRSWLRVLIASLISAVTSLDQKPPVPVMFLLEEMATLGPMPIIQQAVGLMAGYGMQIVMVLQDLTQLRGLYRDSWETFVANSGSVQCFGTSDRFTAEYFSAISGMTSVERLSMESAEMRASIFGDPTFEGLWDNVSGRRLITSDELLSLHPTVQFIKLAGARSAIGYRLAYFLDARFRDRRGKPLFDIHPNHAHLPLPKAVSFSRPGLDLGRVLAGHLKVG